MALQTRYRFAEFVVSKAQRQLFRNGQPLPLIPRYFDLLVLLIERRHTAVSRADIFESVWTDVVVSDGALSQAVRTLRRVLGDDSREPRFVRTVSRHGYTFVYADLVEEEEEPPAPPRRPADRADHTASPDQIDELIDKLLRRPAAGESDEEQRDAAEQLHLLGTQRARDALTRRPGHARALALLRDARWDVPGSGAVPLLGQPEGLAAAWALIRLRASRALRLVERRWASAAVGAGVAGALAGGVGGLVLVNAPTSQASSSVIALLAGLGAGAGALGASGVAAGVVAAEALARSRRGVAIVTGGAVGGLIVGFVAHIAVRWTLEGLFGLRLPIVGGPIEGVLLGSAVGASYAATTQRPGGGGMATATGRARWTSALTVAGCCVVIGLLLAWAERPMVGGIVNAIAQASRGSDLALTPLGALIGDPVFGPVMRTFMAVLESGMFGLGLALGLTRRPRS